MAPCLIPKETVTDYHIVRHEVLANQQNKVDLIRERRKKLEDAASLGNGFKGKVRITFETSDGLKQVETTVWATTASYVTLKSGVVIPISSILEVE